MIYYKKCLLQGKTIPVMLIECNDIINRWTEYKKPCSKMTEKGDHH